MMSYTAFVIDPATQGVHPVKIANLQDVAILLGCNLSNVTKTRYSLNGEFLYVSTPDGAANGNFGAVDKQGEEIFLGRGVWAGVQRKGRFFSANTSLNRIRSLISF